MSRSTAEYCIEQLKDAQILPQHTFGREKVSVKESFLMTLWYLANTETFRQISDRFNVAESCAHNIIQKVVGYFVSVSATYIKWPTEEEAVEIEEEFRKKQGIEGILGAIHGTHILMNRPDQESYCNRIGTQSILLQEVVNHNRRFVDVFCGEPGSLHDARLLKKSSLYDRAQNGSLNFKNRYLLGDSAYPSLPWLVPPKKDNSRLTEEEKNFNFKHSSSRIIVENAFGLLKGRFIRLTLRQ